MNTHDHLIDLADRYLGPIGAWCVQALLMAFQGMNIITGVGTLAALWWTVERARHERAKRRLAEIRAEEYSDYVQANRGTLGRLVDRMRGRTEPGRFADTTQ